MNLTHYETGKEFLMMKRVKKTDKQSSRVSKSSTVDYKISLSDYHPNHDRHLCKMVELRNMKSVGDLAKGARYMCFLCGRAARNKSNLCEPVDIR